MDTNRYIFIDEKIKITLGGFAPYKSSLRISFFFLHYTCTAKFTLRWIHDPLSIVNAITPSYRLLEHVVFPLLERIRGHVRAIGRGREAR